MASGRIKSRQGLRLLNELRLQPHGPDAVDLAVDIVIPIDEADGVPGRRRRAMPTEAAYPATIRGLAFAATLIFMSSTHAGPPLLDFSRAEVVREFRIVNDAVMGGISTSQLRPTDAGVRFEGEVSLENNGGFASFRGPVRIPADSAGLLVTVRGDGQRYKLTLKLDDSTGTAQYQAAFVAPREWQTLRFSPADFAASFRGRAVAAPVVRFVDVQYLGALISDKQSGAFRMELKDIRAE